MAKPQNSTSSRRSAQKKHKETKSKKEETKTTPKKKETKPKPKKEETKPKKQQSKKEETKSKKKAESESKATKEVDAKKAGKMKKQPTATPESEAKDAASASPVHREKLRLFPARLVNPANVVCSMNALLQLFAVIAKFSLSVFVLPPVILQNYSRDNSDLGVKLYAALGFSPRGEYIEPVLDRLLGEYEKGRLKRRPINFLCSFKCTTCNLSHSQAEKSYLPVTLEAHEYEETEDEVYEKARPRPCPRCKRDRPHTIEVHPTDDIFMMRPTYFGVPSPIPDTITLHEFGSQRPLTYKCVACVCDNGEGTRRGLGHFISYLRVCQGPRKGEWDEADDDTYTASVASNGTKFHAKDTFSPCLLCFVLAEKYNAFPSDGYLRELPSSTEEDAELNRRISHAMMCSSEKPRAVRTKVDRQKNAEAFDAAREKVNNAEAVVSKGKPGPRPNPKKEDYHQRRVALKERQQHEREMKRRAKETDKLLKNTSPTVSQHDHAARAPTHVQLLVSGEIERRVAQHQTTRVAAAQEMVDEGGLWRTLNNRYPFVGDKYKSKRTAWETKYTVTREQQLSETIATVNEQMQYDWCRPVLNRIADKGALLSVSSARIALIAERSEEAELTDDVPSRTTLWKLMKRWKLRVTTWIQSARPNCFESTRKRFRSELATLVKKFSIHPSMIFNFDETSFRMLPETLRAWILGTGNRHGVCPELASAARQFVTCVVTISADGVQHPTQIIWDGTTARCHGSDPQTKDHPLFHDHSKSHWSTFTTLQHLCMEIDKIRKKNAAKLPNGYSNKAIILLDMAPVHTSRKFVRWFYDTYTDIFLVFVPPGCTAFLQPEDAGYLCAWKPKVRARQKNIVTVGKMSLLPAKLIWDTETVKRSVLDAIFEAETELARSHAAKRAWREASLEFLTVPCLSIPVHPVWEDVTKECEDFVSEPKNVESMFPIAIPTAAAALKIAGDSARFDRYLAGAIDEVELVDYAAIGTTRHYTSEGADWESASNEDEVNEEIEENVEGPNPSKRGRSPTPSDCDAPNSPHGGDSPPRHRSPHRADVASLADDSQSSTSPSYSSDGSDSTSSSDLDASSDASS